MIVLRGKYAFAKVMIDEVDETTRAQIINFLNCPVFKGSNIVIMPDCHAGMGSCIGFTAPLNDYIIPQIVGVDIGCGVHCVELGDIDIDFNELDKFIRENIPYGFHIHDEPMLDSNTMWATDYRNACRTEDKTQPFKALGTLGGGNHFIEINVDDDCNKYLCIHSGSRKFGHSIAEHYQKEARAYMKKILHGDSFRDLEFLVDQKREAYLVDMRTAQRYAEENRYFIMMNILMSFFNYDREDPVEYFSCVHNYVNFDDNIIRKGAISAHKDERVVIPLNMRDGSIIGVGKGNKDWNYSAPHGAGRTLSRRKAKETLDIDEFKQTMEDAGVFTTCVSRNTLDESPMAYKDKQLIIDSLEETVTIEKIIRPIYNFKA